jgi:hypothetical protein
MDWDLVISRNRDLLLKIVASLFAMAGVADDRMFGPHLGMWFQPRPVRSAILMVLRPAESAARRLVIIAARGLVLKLRPSSAAPAGAFPFARKGVARAPAFLLIDPLKPFPYQNRPHFTRTQPRIRMLGGFEPLCMLPQFRAPPPPPVNGPDGPARVFQRLAALKRALEDLPRQARRLARWRARQDLARKSKGPHRPRRASPMRPGLPPGHRGRHLHEVDAVLKDCHYFAHEADSRPDTS